MSDYFSEYSAVIGSKSLPSPAGTPYETPGFIRSKRASRATPGSSREQSSSPPPLPPDTSEIPEKSRDGRYGALDPRRFTPTLHASLVSEILNLRRELDSKNNLVENLETSLADSKNENETLNEQISQQSKDVRKARQQVQQIEKGTYDAVEDLVKERDAAISHLEDARTKLESAQKSVRRQDEDAERTQRIWETEKESWDNERRQLERRVHITETRLRAVVDEMTAQQAASETQRMLTNESDDTPFKDSGLGNESDDGSVRSASPTNHRRNKSSLSFKGKNVRDSAPSRATGTPDLFSRAVGYSLADELGIDEETEYDIDEFDHPNEELDMEFAQRLRQTVESRNSILGDADAKAKRILGITSGSVDSPLTSPTTREFPKTLKDDVGLPDAASQSPPIAEQGKGWSIVSEPKPARPVQYVDNGFQPSPPPSPPQTRTTAPGVDIPRIEEPVEETEKQETEESQMGLTMPLSESQQAPAPLSPPETPRANDAANKQVPALSYNSTSTQTEIAESDTRKKHQSRDSLSPPDYVPSIAIHPSSRPSSPRAYVLPPGTKNAFTQTRLPWSSRDAAVQTEEIRVDKRPVKLPEHLLPNYLLPSPTFQEPRRSRLSKRASAAGLPNIITTAPAASVPSAPPSSQAQSPIGSSPEKMSRNSSNKDLRNMPLRAIPLPRPVLSPPLPPPEPQTQGPLNRSSQYGVTKSAHLSSPLLDIDKDSELSDYDGTFADFDAQDLASAIPGIAKAPHGRFGLSGPPKAVPEDKEISPERRPDTAGSTGAAPAPSISSSRANSTRARNKPGKLASYKDVRSRSPSFASMASSNYSVQSAAPPFPIPTRSSSRIVPNSHSEGSQSPTPLYNDVFGNRRSQQHRLSHDRQASLRKVQSAAVIRQPPRKKSPTKIRRRRHSPDLTPVQSMLVESPAPTKFPIPDVPTPVRTNTSFDYVKGSVDLSGRPGTAASSAPRQSNETNLVDAIAATMVGEWMWKYIRKRKSFGVQEDFPIGEDGSVNISAGTTRHKRWVWLSPYERTIMWDSKQPISNSALLGKKGRKLAIQSVMDVQDQMPMPKNPELRSAHSRSILILTPARALKFTATSVERHALWMTALSFLAQSGRLPSQIPPMPSQAQAVSRGPPPIPSQDPAPIKRSRSPSFGRLTVRDSIRLAKGKRPELPKSASQPLDNTSQPFQTSEEYQRDDSADFPAVPRLYSGTSRHQRKRSNTSPRLPTSLNGFRSMSSTAISSTSSALHPPSSQSSFFRTNFAGGGNSSKSGSRHDSMSDHRPNFFEAVGNGTVRMEAFVDPNVRDGVLYVPAPPVTTATAPIPGPAEPRRQRGESHVSSQISKASLDKRRAGHIFDDPFRSFDFTAAGNDGITVR